MPGMDVFANDAFSLISLTDRFNKMPFVPGQAGKLGIFVEKPITTTDVAIEEYDGTLSLIPTTMRGAPPIANAHKKRQLRKLIVPHLQLEDAVGADEIQNVRAFGSEDVLQGVQSVIDIRNSEMGSKHDATVEYGRIGALKGIILDADGSTVIYNLYNEFGVSQPQVDLDLGTSATSTLNKATEVADIIDDELGAMGYDMPFAFLGKTLWEEFISSPNVKTAYQYFQATGQNMNPLRDDLRYKGFEFGGMLWTKYRGKVGGIPFVPDAEGIAFPLGADIYRTYYAPANFIETVNTPGLPRYAKQIVNKLGTAVDIYTQSNPLSITMRPGAHVKLISST